MVIRVPPMAGLVLCGGRSRRMGLDKARMLVDGRPMYVAVAERVAGIADPVLLAPGASGRLGETSYAEVADRVAGAGPIAGIESGLSASPHELLAVVAVDMPHVSPGVLSLLAGCFAPDAEKADAEEIDAAIPVTSTGTQYLHAVYARSALPHMSAALLAGRLAVGEAIAGLRVRLVDEEEWREADDAGSFADNVNAPADAARLGIVPVTGEGVRA